MVCDKKGGGHIYSRTLVQHHQRACVLFWGRVGFGLVPQRQQWSLRGYQRLFVAAWLDQTGLTVSRHYHCRADSLSYNVTCFPFWIRCNSSLLLRHFVPLSLVLLWARLLCLGESVVSHHTPLNDKSIGSKPKSRTFEFHLNYTRVEQVAPLLVILFLNV